MEVTAFPRTNEGKGASRRLRATGRVPGVIYGGGKDAQSVELDHKALLRHLKIEAFHASILDMTVEGSKDRVLLRDFQMHPWKEQVQHVDFLRVDPKKKVYMAVPLHFLNADIAPGVKLGKGVVQHIINELEIQCLPDDLPEYIEVDLKDLELDDSIHVADLVLPKGVETSVKLRTDNPSVVTVQVPREIAVEEAVAAPETEITAQAPEAAAAAAGAAAAGGDKKEAEKKPAEKK
ncbi:MAG: 50S ribosomal protein L25/general stress protein Ctc [Betaproteobacteria bacterium]|nr:50S ribosomal protein L25/general stress protein Ctc [Betaproteobacteria bacterium]MDH5342389.1 50S ribosomal protein L25/general stress protein Ctc [Betaproteobacteria bacterium]